MKAAERVFDYEGSAANLVAATASHLKGPAWEEFLAAFTKEPSVARVLRKFAETMEHIDEIGSLARPAEDLRAIIKEEHATWERQVREQKEANFLFPEIDKEALSGQLSFHEITDEDFSDRLFYRAKAGIDAFTQRARESGDFDDQMLASETRAGFRLVDLLSRRYDVVAANPPYMGSKNMGPESKSHIRRISNPGKATCTLRLSCATPNWQERAGTSQWSRNNRGCSCQHFFPSVTRRRQGLPADYLATTAIKSLLNWGGMRSPRSGMLPFRLLCSY